MGHDPIEVSQTANKVVKILSKSRRVGYKTNESVVILPETNAQFVSNSSYGGLAMYAPETPLNITSGDKLTIIWDGKKYNCTVYLDEGSNVVWFGNLVLAGGNVDTGEPFAYTMHGTQAFFCAQSEGKHTFKVTLETETIHPIDPKYLPGVCLPVVELSTVVPTAGAEAVLLSDAEKTALNDYSAKQQPILLKYTTGVYFFIALACPGIANESVVGYFATDVLTNALIQIMKTEENWEISTAAPEV